MHKLSKLPQARLVSAQMLDEVDQSAELLAPPASRGRSLISRMLVDPFLVLRKRVALSKMKTLIHLQ